jgi:hypothetical protein
MSYHDEEQCFVGYALEMKTVIRRMKNVNLLTGVFDLSYTSFADYIHAPKYGRQIKAKRDYHSASYEELKKFKFHWDEYQARQQDERRANEQCRARANTGNAEAPPPPKQSTRAHCDEE